MGDAGGWIPGKDEDWRAGLSDTGRLLCEAAEDASDEESARVLTEVDDRSEGGHETEEEYEAALQAAGDQLKDLRYLRNELSSVGILALIDEEHKQELWEQEQRAMRQVGLTLGPSIAFKAEGEAHHAEEERQHQLRMRELWEAQQRARGRIGASMALVAAGRYRQTKKAKEETAQQLFSSTALSKQISEDVYTTLHAQYQASATRRLNLSGAAFSGLTEAGLEELTRLFPEAQELFYDHQSVDPDKIGVLVKGLPRLRCGYLGGFLSPEGFEAAREHYEQTRELDLTASMEAGYKAAAEDKMVLVEAALAELPGLFPKLEAVFLPIVTSKDNEQHAENELETKTEREKGQKKEEQASTSTLGHAFARRTQELRELRWKAASQHNVSRLSSRRADAGGETVTLTDEPLYLQFPLEPRSARWFFDREKRPTLNKDELIEASIKDRTCPDLITMENRAIASLWDRCLLDERERTPYENMARNDQERYAAETKEFGEITVVLPATVPTETLGEEARTTTCVTIRTLTAVSQELGRLHSTVDTLTMSNNHSLSSPGISGPILELYAAANPDDCGCASGYNGTVSVTFDATMMLQKASSKAAASESSSGYHQALSCVLLVLRQQSDGSPWLPLHESESVSLDLETSQATIHLRWLGRITVRLFYGPRSAEHAAMMTGNTLAHTTSQLKVNMSADDSSTVVVLKYAALSVCQANVDKATRRVAASAASDLFSAVAGGLCGFVLQRDTDTADILEETTESTRMHFGQALQRILAKETWCEPRFLQEALRDKGVELKDAVEHHDLPRQSFATMQASSSVSVDLHGLQSALDHLRAELEPQVMIAGMAWKTLLEHFLQPASKQTELETSDTAAHVICRSHHPFQAAITQLKGQLPSLKVAHLGCEITQTEYRTFALQYASKQKLHDVWTEDYSDSAAAEMLTLWPNTRPSRMQMSQLETAMETNAKLKQRNDEVDKALIEAGRKRLQRAEALKEKEEFLAQMLARSNLDLEDRCAQLAAADRATKEENARYTAMIAEKERRLSEYRSAIAAQEAVLRERETQISVDFQRLMELNAALDKIQGQQPLSLLPKPSQASATAWTRSGTGSMPPVRLAVGSPAAIEFNTKCLAAQATVTPAEVPKLAKITLKMAKAGDETAICDALAQGADPNTANERDADETVLYFAAKAGHAGCVAALLAAGADVNRGGNDGWTPLMHAVHAGERNCTAVCRVLLDARADVAATNITGRTAFDMAIESVKRAEEDEDEVYDLATAQEALVLLRSVDAPAGADLSPRSRDS